MCFRSAHSRRVHLRQPCHGSFRRFCYRTLRRDGLGRWYRRHGTPGDALGSLRNLCSQVRILRQRRRRDRSRIGGNLRGIRQRGRLFLNRHRPHSYRGRRKDAGLYLLPQAGGRCQRQSADPENQPRLPHAISDVPDQGGKLHLKCCPAPQFCRETDSTIMQLNGPVRHR